MRGTQEEETLLSKEVYERLTLTHGARVYTYWVDNRRFAETLFKEAIQKCRQQMSYCGVGSHHQNAIVERRIKELTLGSCTFLLHTTRLWPKAVSNMPWPFYFKASCQRYNRL